MHALTFAEQLVAGLDLAEAPDCLPLLAAGLVVDVGDRPAGPAAAADRVVLAQRAVPFLLAPLERLEGAALEREARIFGLGHAQIVDEVVDLLQWHRVAGKEARNLLPPGAANRTGAQVALGNPPRQLRAVGLGARDRVPERLLARGHFLRRSEEMVGLELGQEGRGVLLVERAALGRDH